MAARLLPKNVPLRCSKSKTLPSGVLNWTLVLEGHLQKPISWRHFSSNAIFYEPLEVVGFRPHNITWIVFW